MDPCFHTQEIYLVVMFKMENETLNVFGMVNRYSWSLYNNDNFWKMAIYNTHSNFPTHDTIKDKICAKFIKLFGKSYPNNTKGLYYCLNRRYTVSKVAMLESMAKLTRITPVLRWLYYQYNITFDQLELNLAIMGYNLEYVKFLREEVGIVILPDHVDKAIKTNNIEIIEYLLSASHV